MHDCHSASNPGCVQHTHTRTHISYGHTHIAKPTGAIGARTNRHRAHSAAGVVPQRSHGAGRVADGRRRSGAARRQHGLRQSARGVRQGPGDAVSLRPRRHPTLCPCVGTEWFLLLLLRAVAARPTASRSRRRCRRPA